MKTIRNKYAAICRKLYVASSSNSTALLFVLGIGLLATGLVDVSLANDPGKGVANGDYRIANFGTMAFELIEGNLGSLIMISAGLAAIIAAAFGAYRAAVGLLVVAVGAFILRSLVDIFFNFSG